METRDIGVGGMTCDHCVRKVEKALRAVNGVAGVQVDRQAALATVTFDRTRTDLPALRDVLLKIGYPPTASGEG
jgi:copper chaperone CopZ